jgi:hypothetical protein
MAQKPHSDEELREVLAAVEQHGGVSPAAVALGIGYATFQSRYRSAVARFGKPKPQLPTDPPSIPESFSVSGDDAEVVKGSYEQVKSLADLVRVCEIDTSEWEIERFTCNKWAMGAKDDKGKLISMPLYQVKAWMKRKRHIVDAKLEIATLLADAAAKMPKRPSLVRSVKAETNILFEPHIPDLHMGKLAWGEETGWENYDLKTAESVFDTAIDALIVRARSFGCDRVLLPWGNDLLHYDNEKGMTTSGTQLDSADSRIQKVFTTVRRMTVRTIDRLREEVGPVTVLMIPGNHDRLMVWCLGDSLSSWYRQDAGVQIDNEPTKRKYHQHGSVMLMFTHGNTGKLEKYPELMAAERPEMWGATTYREAHTGDKHHQRVLEMKGCKVRISPALCPPDSWHSDNHFVGVARAAEAFIWSPVEGLIGTAHYTVQREGAA